MSGVDKTLNSEKSFRVVARLCACENIQSHTFIRVYYALGHAEVSLKLCFVYLFPLCWSLFLKTSWNYIFNPIF